MKPRSHTKRHAAVRAPRARVASCGLVVIALLLFVVAPLSLNAQSGRKRPEPTPTPQLPAGQRPRRATTNTNAPGPRPTPADQPGQPATPDEPRNVPLPTPTPLKASDPDTGQSVVIDPDEVVHVNSNLVPIPASVIDELGRAVTDLEVKDFELRVDGQPKPIGDLSRADTPVRLALLFDNSYSLRSARELEKQSAMRFFRSVIRPVDQAAIFSIWTEPVLEQPLTSDVNRLVSTIERYGDPDGSTSLFDTIVYAADYLRPQPGRKVIIIVSDGVETTSQLQDFNEVLRRVQSADVQVYVVQSEINPNANLHDLTAERRMQELAASTGGAVFAPQTTSDLPAAFAHISADLAQQYVLSYYPDDERRDTRFRTISLRVTTRPGARVRARRGYYPRRAQLSAAPRYDVEQVAQLTPDATPLTGGAAQAPRTDAPAPTVRTNAPATGPSYGSKNLNPDDDGVTSRRAAPPPNPAPAERARNETPPPHAATDTRPAETRIVVAANAAPPATTPTPTPEPTPAQPRPTPTPAPAQPTPSPTPAETKSPDAAAAQPARTPAPVSGGMLNSRAVKLPKPIFPDTARRMRVSGAVTVEVTIDEGGKVVSARAVSGPALLREAATAAARQAVFTPTILHDKPVRVSGVIVYNFSQ